MSGLAFSSAPFFRPYRSVLRSLQFTSPFTSSPPSTTTFICSYSSRGRRDFEHRYQNNSDNERRNRPSRSSSDNNRRFSDNNRSDRRGRFNNGNEYFSSRQQRSSSFNHRGNNNERPPSLNRSRNFDENDDEFQFVEEGSDNDSFVQRDNYGRNHRKREGSNEYSNYRSGRSNYNSDGNSQKFNRFRDRDRSPRNNFSNRSNDRFRERSYGQNEEEPVSEERLLIRKALDSEEDDLLYGISPVLLALKSELREEKRHLFVQEQSNSTTDSTLSNSHSKKQGNIDAFESILSICKNLEIPTTFLSKHNLNLLSENRPHQGIILQASKREFQELKNLPLPNDKKQTCYLVLDEITDPQNAGALLRSAHFLGADGVIVCRRNSCSLSAVVSKASAGALELMDVHGISSMPKFLRTCRDDGWRIIGMDCDDNAVSAKSLTLDKPTLIVLGSEGRGLRTLVKQACEILVEIDGGRQRDEVDSLNVSVAGAVALYQLLGR